MQAIITAGWTGFGSPGQVMAAKNGLVGPKFTPDRIFRDRTLSTDYACSYDCIIKEGGASYRTLWIVHSHYRGTVKSKYVDIAISFAQPSQDSQLDQFYPPN